MVGKTGTVDLTDSHLEKLVRGDHDRVRLWDSKLTGFGVTIGKLRTSFVVQHRIGSEQRTITVGHWGPQKLRALQPHLLNVARAMRRFACSPI